jgi:sterol desaturase/sphingolipid hydroxylase (fatty acid hydroxylase superfamily)
MFKTIGVLAAALWPIGLAVAIGAAGERFWPWRKQLTDWLRWLHAGVLYVAATLVSNLVLPIGVTGVAFLAADKNWGVLNVFPVPLWLSVLISILIIDFTQWICHWTMHHSASIWRIHRLHHSDEVIDVATAFRFHPAETLYRFLAQAIVIMAFGIPPLAVAISAALTIAADVWEHANIRFPQWLQFAASVIVTPDFHRIHHTTETRHQNSNLGTLFTFWDRLFGSYISSDALTTRARFGLGQHDLSYNTLADFLVDPLRSQKDERRPKCSKEMTRRVI